MGERALITGVTGFVGSRLARRLSATGWEVHGVVRRAWQRFGNAEYSPVSLYAATKKAFADLLQYFVDAAGMRAVTLELTDTYGPGDGRRKLIPIMYEAEQLKRELSMVSGDLAARWGERPYRAREVLDQWTQGVPLPGWKAQVSLAEGLRGL